MAGMIAGLAATNAARSINRHGHGEGLPRCPKCGQVIGGDGLSKREEIWIVLCATAIVIVLFWIIVTLIAWMDPYPDKSITLMQVIKNQWHWLFDLLHRVW